MGLNEETYTNMMVKCNVFNLRANGIKVQQDNIRNLFTTLNIEAELDRAQPDGCQGKRWWMRLGPTQEGYHHNATNQVNAQDFMPPRNGSLATYKRRLKHAIDEENRSNNENSKSDGNKSEEGETDDYDQECNPS